MKGLENGGDVIIFSHPHQDPSSAVLYVLKPLKAIAWDPDEEVRCNNPAWRRQKHG